MIGDQIETTKQRTACASKPVRLSGDRCALNVGPCDGPRAQRTPLAEVAGAAERASADGSASATDLAFRGGCRTNHVRASSFCASVTRSRFLTESFRSRRSRFGRLNGPHEVDQNGGCQIRTTTLVVCDSLRAREVSVRRQPSACAGAKAGAAASPPSDRPGAERGADGVYARRSVTCTSTGCSSSFRLPDQPPIWEGGRGRGPPSWPGDHG